MRRILAVVTLLMIGLALTFRTAEAFRKSELLSYGNGKSCAIRPLYGEIRIHPLQTMYCEGSLLQAENIEPGRVQVDPFNIAVIQPAAIFGLAASLAGALVLGLSVMVLSRDKANGKGEFAGPHSTPTW